MFNKGQMGLLNLLRVARFSPGDIRDVKLVIAKHAVYMCLCSVVFDVKMIAELSCVVFTEPATINFVSRGWIMHTTQQL